MVLVGSYRSEEVPPSSPLGWLLGELGPAPWVDRIALAPFTRDDIAELVADIRGGEAPAALVDRVFARSGGNPFFAEELLATGAAADRLPDTIRAAVLARLGRLGAAARAVATVVAVGGRWPRRGASLGGPRVRDELLLEVAGLDPTELDGAVAELVGAALLVADVDGVGFRHPFGPEGGGGRPGVVQVGWSAASEDTIPASAVAVLAAWATGAGALAALAWRRLVTR